MTTPANLVFIMSDEHARGALGCYGHPLVRTPRLDALAAGGTRFVNAYTPSPICVPARAAFATGQPVHRIGAWDNAHPYEGHPPGWAHALRDAGHEVISIGKLHYRSDEIDAGFTRQIEALHVVGGQGDLRGSLRDPLPEGNRRMPRFVERLGPGESDYTAYDRRIAAAAVRWLEEEAPRLARPWVLFVSFVCPHHPLIAPPEFFALYPPEAMPAPKPPPAKMHPWAAAVRRVRNHEDFFTEETRRLAIASYFGLCSFLDHNVGQVLDAVERAGLGAGTRIVYASDHGENLGARGLWGKYNLYEEAAGIPLIVAGPGVPRGRVARTPATLLDAHPAILEGAGLTVPGDAAGTSLWHLAQQEQPDRAVLSEYHASGSPSAGFMLRRGRWKYLHYVGYAPELFDLEADPEELQDRAGDPACAAVRASLEAELRRQLDPEAVEARAKADQAALIARHGGREAVIGRGVFQGTPAPGVAAEWRS